ncbi:HAD family hydrolase [Chloroflexota bacterium]
MPAPYADTWKGMMATKTKFKLLVVDIDGTLIGISKTVSAQNREAVERAIRANIAVSISTGRSLKSSLNILNQLVLDSYHIFFDGAFAGPLDFSEEIFVSPIPPDIVKQMVEFSREHGINTALPEATS